MPFFQGTSFFVCYKAHNLIIKNSSSIKLSSPLQLSNPYLFHFNLPNIYSIVQTMENSREYVIGNGLTGDKIQELITDVNYSTPGQFQCRNHSLQTSSNYAHRQSNLSLLTVHQTMDSNKNLLMERSHIDGWSTQNPLHYSSHR